jgi:hypothetical protein
MAPKPTKRCSVFRELVRHALQTATPSPSPTIAGGAPLNPKAIELAKHRDRKPPPSPPPAPKVRITREELFKLFGAKPDNYQKLALALASRLGFEVVSRRRGRRPKWGGAEGIGPYRIQLLKEVEAIKDSYAKAYRKELDTDSALRIRLFRHGEIQLKRDYQRGLKGGEPFPLLKSGEPLPMKTLSDEDVKVFEKLKARYYGS